MAHYPTQKVVKKLEDNRENILELLDSALQSDVGWLNLSLIYSKIQEFSKENKKLYRRLYNETPVSIKQFLEKRQTSSIIGFLAEGDSAREISEKLGISTRTLEGRLERLRKEFSAKNTTHLVAIFLKNKL